MKFNSPLRYPGGKNKLAKFICLICKENNIGDHYIEPYAGGSSVALFLLFNNYVSKITINDIDRSIYAFWWSVLNRNKKFCEMINNVEINIENWKKQKEIQKNKEKVNLLELGFSTFFLNRTNISGIINGGAIGGVKQEGVYKIDCRFNKIDLINRIKKIGQYRKKINLYNLDALDLIKKVKKESKKEKIIFYFDPPYYIKGKSLYINHYKHEDHQKVSEEIKKIKKHKWIVSYDNNLEIKKMYKNYKKKEYSFFHTAYKSIKGEEILFFSKDLIVPKVFNPTKFITPF